MLVEDFFWHVEPELEDQWISVRSYDNYYFHLLDHGICNQKLVNSQYMTVEEEIYAWNFFPL